MNDIDISKYKNIAQCLGGQDLIGVGLESIAFDYSKEKILKIFRMDNRSGLDKLKEFYQWLSDQDLPFAVPKIHYKGHTIECDYLIEKKLAGIPMDLILPILSHEDKEILLCHYLDAIAALANIQLKNDRYGEILSETPRQAPNWASFLIASFSTLINRHKALLAKQAIPIEQLTERLIDATHNLRSDFNQPVLVHGDYCPANVMVDPCELKINAVFDFGPLTLCGDHLFDVSTAMFYLELCAGYVPIDSEIMQALISKHYPNLSTPLMHLYKAYCSLQFIAYNDPLYPTLSEWCIQNLKTF